MEASGGGLQDGDAVDCPREPGGGFLQGRSGTGCVRGRTLYAGDAASAAFRPVLQAAFRHGENLPFGSILH